MKILVTGATGFVGKNLVKYLKKNTKHVIVTEDWSYSELYDVIINLASKSSVEQSISNPQGVIGNNITHTLSMLEMARQHTPKLFIQFSTVEAGNITNPYAASKRSQEVIAESYSKTYDIPLVIIRATNIIGKGQSNEKFVPKIIEQIKADEPVTIYTDNGKIGERHYNPVNNIGGAIVHLLSIYDNYNSGSGLCETLAIGGGQTLSNLNMAQLIAKLLNKELTCKFVDTENIRPNYLMRYDNDNLNMIQASVLQTLPDALKELL